MAEWGPNIAEELRRDVRFALTFKVARSRRPLTDTERDMVSSTPTAANPSGSHGSTPGRRGPHLRENSDHS
jgi:hypothetical protein